MSTVNTNTITSITTNENLSLAGNGTGGVKITDYLVQTKGSDIASATALTLGKDGNFFDVTGTTTITSIGTQGIGSLITLHFDGILTFTHHSTNLILPSAANITTATGDIATLYEYASGDWRCVSYTKAAGTVLVDNSAGAFLGEGASGGSVSGSGDIIRINQQTLDTSQTMAATDNGSCTGPFGLAAGVTLTISSGATFKVL
jgi:hypothetical protein